MPSNLIISFDFELGWGVLENNGWHNREATGVYKNLRQVFPEIMTKLKEHEITTTWAVVSNLLAESVADLDVDHLPELYKKDVLSFYNDAERETRCGIDLFEQLVSELDSLCDIGTHTASHLYCGHPSAKPSHILNDIVVSVKKLKEFSGRNIDSLVYPRDQVQYRFDVAKKTDLTMRINPSWGEANGQIHRILNSTKRMVGRIPESQVVNGLQDVIFQTGSMNFNAPKNRFSLAKKLLLSRSLASLCDRLEEGKGVYHVWLHPFNLSESSFVYRKFMDFLDVVGSLQQGGRLEVISMQDVAYRAKLNLPLVK